METNSLLEKLEALEKLAMEIKAEAKEIQSRKETSLKAWQFCEDNFSGKSSMISQLVCGYGGTSVAYFKEKVLQYEIK